MRRDQFDSKLKELNLSQQDLDRRWRLFNEELELQRLPQQFVPTMGGVAALSGYRISIEWFYSYFMEGVPPEFYEPSFWSFVFTGAGDYNPGLESTGVTIEEELPGGVFRTVITFNSQMVLPPLMLSFGKKPATIIRSFLDLDGAVTELKYAVFSNSDGLVEVSLPACTVFSDYAPFSFCDSLTTLNLPALITTYGISFYQCTALESVNLPNLITMGGDEFSGCTSLTAVNLPFVTNVGGYAFYSCSLLEEISLPSAVNIGYNCFASCSSLSSVIIPACTNLGGDVIDNGVFNDITPKPFFLSIDASRETCNSGNPDGDIEALVAAMSPEVVIINYV